MMYGRANTIRTRDMLSFVMLTSVKKMARTLLESWRDKATLPSVEFTWLCT